MIVLLDHQKAGVSYPSARRDLRLCSRSTRTDVRQTCATPRPMTRKPEPAKSAKPNDGPNLAGAARPSRSYLARRTYTGTEMELYLLDPTTGWRRTKTEPTLGPFPS
jgi:hypothetical protein